MAKKRKKDERGEYGRGSVYRNSDGSWTVAVRLQPGKPPVRRRAADEQSAEVVREALLKMRDRGLAEDSASLDATLETLEKLRDKQIDIDHSITPFDVFINHWFNVVVRVREGITEGTLSHYRGIIRRYLIPHFDSTPIIQIKTPDIIAFLNQLRAHLSPSYVRQIRSALEQALDAAVGWHWLVFNPCTSVERPKVKKPQKPVLTIAQVRGLLAIVEGHPTEPIWHVIATLGTRLGETLALRRQDFNADFSEVQIATQINYHTLKRTTPKDDSVRPLPVPPRLREQLARQWELVCKQRADAPPNFKHGDLIFPSEVGTPFQPSNIEKVWHGYTHKRRTKKRGLVETRYPGFKERAALPDWATIHSLRGFVATMLEDVGAEQRTTGHILGHGAKNVTERYIKKFIPTMRRALEAVEAAVWAEAGEETKTGT